MKLFFDTSVLVEIDRQNPTVVSLLKKLVEREDELQISTITVAEILTGPLLCRNPKEAGQRAREVLNQFSWIDFTPRAAEISATLNAGLLLEKQTSDYADILIAATSLCERADALITLNKKDFVVFSQLQENVFSPQEFARRMS